MQFNQSTRVRWPKEACTKCIQRGIKSLLFVALVADLLAISTFEFSHVCMDGARTMISIKVHR